MRSGHKDHRDSGLEPGNERALGKLLRVAGARPQPPPEAERWVYERLVAEWEKKIRRRYWARHQLPLAMAASLILVITAVFWIRVMPGPDPAAVASVARITGNAEYTASAENNWRPLPTGSTLSPGSSVRADSITRVALALNDGGSLRLDIDTTLVLDAQNRLRLLTGAVYLDTGTDPATNSQPIEIVTDYGTVRDIGTQFEVRVQEQSIRVSVREGTAELDDQATIHEAVAGQSMRITSDGRVARQSISPSDPSWDWLQEITPAFDINNRSLDEFLNWVSRETGMRVVYSSLTVQWAAEHVLLKGSVDGMKPLDALPIVLATTDLDYVMNDGEIVVSNRSVR